MRSAQIGILVLGLGLAGYGVYTAQSYISEQQAAVAAAQARGLQAGQQVETTQVLVALRELRFGEPILPEDVAPVEWPTRALPPGVFQEVAALIPDISRPRVALRAMEPHEPIMEVKVSEPGQSAGIAALLTPGMRAFTIRVDAGSGVSGTMRPGDMVDLFWTGRGSQGDVTRLLFSALRIIALDENPDRDRQITGIPRSITIEAPPEVVATIAQGQSSGRLTISVVGLDDERQWGGIEIDNRSLLGVQATTELPVERCTIRTRRGADVVVMEIPCTN